MGKFTLSGVLMGMPATIGDFEAPGDSDALWFGRGFVAALCEIRSEFEIGSRWRIDRLVLRGDNPFMDETTLVGECDVVEQDGQIGAIWRVPAPSFKASKQ